MKASLTIILSTILLASFGACERHDWESTQRLFPEHESHDEETSEDSGADETSESTEDPTPRNGAPESSERETSVLP